MCGGTDGHPVYHQINHSSLRSLSGAILINIFSSPFFYVYIYVCPWKNGESESEGMNFFYSFSGQWRSEFLYGRRWGRGMRKMSPTNPNEAETKPDAPKYEARTRRQKKKYDRFNLGVWLLQLSGRHCPVRRRAAIHTFRGPATSYYLGGTRGTPGWEKNGSWWVPPSPPCAVFLFSSDDFFFHYFFPSEEFA